MSALFVQIADGYRPATDDDILNESQNAAVRQLPVGQEFASRTEVQRTLVAMLAGKKYESFMVAFLTVQRRLIAMEEMFKGTLDSVNTFPRDIIKRALELNAKGMLLIHNHPLSPAGSQPSGADKRVTALVTRAADLFDIEVLEHFVINSNGTITSVTESIQKDTGFSGSLIEMLRESLKRAEADDNERDESL